MLYFTLKQDKIILTEFQKNVYEMWEIKNNSRRRLTEEDIKNLPLIRAEIAKKMRRIKMIAYKVGVPINITSYPAPIVGGAIINTDFIETILNDNTHSGVGKQQIIDVFNKIEGQLEDKIKKEFFQFMNPFYWIYYLIAQVIRIPFVILEISGFNTISFEASIYGKIIKFTSTLSIAILTAILTTDFKHLSNNIKLIKELFKGLFESIS